MNKMNFIFKSVLLSGISLNLLALDQANGFLPAIALDISGVSTLQSIQATSFDQCANAALSGSVDAFAYRGGACSLLTGTKIIGVISPINTAFLPLYLKAKGYQVSSNSASGGDSSVFRSYTDNFDCVGSDLARGPGDSLESCATSCQGRSDCFGFSFNVSNNSCILKSAMPACLVNYNNGYTYYTKIATIPNSGGGAYPGGGCGPNDPSCKGSGGSIPEASQGNMIIYSRTDRPQFSDPALDPANGIQPGDGSAARAQKQSAEQAARDKIRDPSNAILAQTSYLARVMLQANDVFPPSHISSRVSGETYLSSLIPIEYNYKLLTQASITRNTTGAENIGSYGKPMTKVISDWVQYHINAYCDPLAARTAGSTGAGSALGLGRCGTITAALNSLTKDQKSKGIANGLTDWEMIAKLPSSPTAQDGQAGFAADINANSLFQSKVTFPEPAMRYIYNITNILPEGLSSDQKDYSIPSDMLGKGKNGEDLLSGTKAYTDYMWFMERQSKLSLSQLVLMKIFADRLELSNVKVPITTWDNNGKKTVKYQNTSRYGLLEFESTKRFSDPAWYDRIQQMPTQAILKEIAYMMSLKLTIDFKRYEQEQLQNAMMASLLADESLLAKTLKMQAQNQGDAQQKAQDAVNSMKNQMNGATGGSN